jgi:hypothetical protein
MTTGSLRAMLLNLRGGVLRTVNRRVAMCAITVFAFYVADVVYFESAATTTAVRIISTTNSIGPWESSSTEKAVDDASSITNAAHSSNTSSGSRRRRPFCRHRDEYTRGEWIMDAAIDAFPYRSIPNPDWQPLCDATQRRYEENGTVPSYLKYRWVPNTCDIIKTLNTVDICHRMNGTTIGVMGDSTSQHFAHSLFGQMTGYYDFPSSGSFEMCRQHHNNQSRTSVILKWTRLDRYKLMSEEDDAAVKEILQESDYLVLNWGVHYGKDNETHDMLVRFIESKQAYWGNKPDQHIFWRTNIVSHKDCGQKGDGSRIVPTKPDAIIVADNPAYSSEAVLIQERQLVLPLLQKHMNCTILDVGPATMLRPDGHRIWKSVNTKKDCLHYCEPGPPDFWVLLFFTLVLGNDFPGV